MQESTVQLITVVTSLVGAIAAILGAIAIPYTLWLNTKQLNAATKATLSQSLWNLIIYVRSPELQEAREVIYKLRKKAYAHNFDDWSEDEIKQAKLICASYSAVAILLQADVMVPKLFLEPFGRSIVVCWEIVFPMVDWHRKEYRIPYWQEFEWLKEQAKNTEQEKEYSRLQALSKNSDAHTPK